MRNSIIRTFGGGAAAAVLAGALALGCATSASAGVTGCAAPGGKQEVGAVLGAVIGGLIGNKVGGRHPIGETVIGAAAGAAAGSAIGCEIQKSSPRDDGYRSATYVRDGYRLSRDVHPADYRRMGRTFVATYRVNLRAAPSARAERVGRLRAGERFEALAHVRGTDWVLVGQGGVGVGYVRGDLVRPDHHRYARY